MAAALGALLLAILIAAFCVVRVGAGQVGIRVKLAGDERGVQTTPIVTGWVFYNPLLEQVIVLPTSVHSTLWTQDIRPGSPVDESITFSSLEGVNISSDIALSFHIEPAMTPHLYLRFRKTQLEDLADGYVRSAVRDALNTAASQRSVERIYGAGKAELLSEATAAVRDKLAKDGILIDQLTFTSGLRLPTTVVASINRAMEGTQLAIQAENRVRQVKAEANQAIIQAEGQASAARAKARGEADSRLMKAAAEAKANTLVRASASPAVLQYRAIERWSGTLPAMNGGTAMPMLTLDASELGRRAQEEGGLDGLLEETELAAPVAAKTSDGTGAGASK